MLADILWIETPCRERGMSQPRLRGFLCLWGSLHVCTCLHMYVFTWVGAFAHPDLSTLWLDFPRLPSLCSYKRNRPRNPQGNLTCRGSWSKCLCNSGFSSEELEKVLSGPGHGPSSSILELWGCSELWKPCL